MTIEQTRASVISRLGKLQQIGFSKPTARDLHSNNAMLSRVQRQEQRRYKMAVIDQKKKLVKDISNMDQYLQSVSEYETYMMDLSGESKKGKKNGSPKGPKAPSEPDVVIGKMPFLQRTRLPRYTQRKGRRGRY